jgi:uncharacterized repeat protein (TIGR01451 family)
MSSIDPRGMERMWNIPALAPGQSRVLEYRVRAKEPGKVTSMASVQASGVAEKQQNFSAEVMTANLQMRVVGPETERATVGQTAGYRITIENRGDAELRNVTVRSIFSPDMRPTKATNGGQPFRDSVQWVFREMKPGDVKELNVGLTTASPGLRTVQFTARADKGAEQKAAIKTEFAGVPTLDWDVDVPGTDSVGKTLLYKVTVNNRGTATAKNVEVRVDLPKEVDLIDTTPSAGRERGTNANAVMFPKFDISAGRKTTMTVRVKARVAGEARAIFWLREEGKEVGARHDKTTNIIGTDPRSPSGPPPKTDRSNVGMLPRNP